MKNIIVIVACLAVTALAEPIGIYGNSIYGHGTIGLFPGAYGLGMFGGINAFPFLSMFGGKGLFEYGAYGLSGMSGYGYRIGLMGKGLSLGYGHY